MAIKKSELYSALWKSCDELRGGMDASEYKDYILTLLFVKYVTDRFEGDRYAEISIPVGGSFIDMVAAKNKPDIGEQLNKIIAKLASENRLTGVIDLADFDEDAKIGKGKEKVEKLTKLVAIFQNDSLNFKKNRAGGDDIIGDAYEYLMRNFATESGKSKGQFYTPAEVSRVIAKVIGISAATRADQTVYDPACGSGSLLIRAADEAPVPLSIYGQERESHTAGLAKMNLVLHNKSTGRIIGGESTLSHPAYKEGESLTCFDFAVANPPFSYKAWNNGVDVTGDTRFQGYGATPPEKNGDYAWLMHFIRSLKSTGKGAIILPHGVLFRGNAEATIRESIIKRKIIKGIIGLPANLFYGTGIPACIIVIDKENAHARTGIYMVDASRDFIKDGNKNRLREQDIRKIVDYFTTLRDDDPKYARFVPYAEISEKNQYNLNIPRYIDSSEPEDIQDISAHLQGGIPDANIDALELFWKAFVGLRACLFVSCDRKGYSKLNISKNQIGDAIFSFPAFMDYKKKITAAFTAWKKNNRGKLYYILSQSNPKKFIAELADDIMQKFDDISLIDRYDIYEMLMNYWNEAMQDDVYAISYDGYEAARDIIKEFKKKKDGTPTTVIRDFEGRIIPKKQIIAHFFADAQEAIDSLEADLEGIVQAYETLEEEHGGDDGLLSEVTQPINEKNLKARIKGIKDSPRDKEELAVLKCCLNLLERKSEKKKAVKETKAELEKQAYEQYPKLTLDEIKELVIEKKWLPDIYAKIDDIYLAVSHRLAARVTELAERYEYALPELEQDVVGYENKVKVHLNRMGFVW